MFFLECSFCWRLVLVCWRLVRISGLKVLVRTLVLLPLERPLDNKSPSGFSVCVTEIKMGVLGSLGFRDLRSHPGAVGQRSGRRCAGSRRSCHISFVKPVCSGSSTAEAQYEGRQKGWPLGSEAKTRTG